MRTKVVHQTTRIWNHFPSNLKIPPVVSRRTLPGPLAAWHLLGPSRATWRPDDPWRWKEDDDWHVKDCGVVWTFANPTNKKQRSQSQSWNEKTPKLKIRKLGRWWKKLPKRVSEKKCLNIKKKKNDVFWGTQDPLRTCTTSFFLCTSPFGTGTYLALTAVGEIQLGILLRGGVQIWKAKWMVLFERSVRGRKCYIYSILGTIQPFNDDAPKENSFNIVPMYTPEN